MKVVAVAALVGCLLVGSPASAQTVASWNMNERSGRVMHDQIANHDGRLGRLVDPGGGVYRFPGVPRPRVYRPSVIVKVPESNNLDPGGGNFAVTVRMFTNRGHPNIVQKGQANQTGGYWKVEQAPGGWMRCAFRDGRNRDRAVGAGLVVVRKWATVRCVNTPSFTRIIVKAGGRRMVRTNVGPLSPINNTRPLVVGGKLDCRDGTCDYFRGRINWVRIEKW